MNRRRWLGGGAGVVVTGALVIHLALGDVGSVFTGAAARLVCTAVFAAERDPEVALRQDLDERLSAPGKYIDLARTSVDFEAQEVRATLFGWQPRIAVHREGLGCTVAEGVSVDELHQQSPGVPWALPEPSPTALWPEGEATDTNQLPDGVDAAALLAAIDAGFQDADPARPRRTRAVVVVHAGRIVGEQYADGFNEATEHLSNSVAKSVTASLIGVLVQQGKLDVDAPAPVAEWQEPGDPRGAITLDDLLRMSSGLAFEESYSKVKSDITMQYAHGDLAGYAASRPLEADPGTRFHYSTGTANLLGRIVREAASDDLAEGLAFPRRALFEPLGMRNTVLEADGMGNFVGGSAVHASARDYARLGLLYLRDGVWNGTRILPEGWVDYVTTPTEGADADAPYGAQFWLNWDGQSDVRRHEELPRDAFFMNGHQGQHVIIIPSRDVVVVRTGLTEFGNFDVGEYVAGILEALPA